MVKQTQFRFNAGELDPNLLGRKDIDKYYSALKKANNVHCEVQGGITRANGSKFMDLVANQIVRLTESISINLPNGGSAANINDDNDATFSITTNPIGTTDNYVIVSYELPEIKKIKFVDIINASITSGASNEFFIQASIDGIDWDNVASNINISSSNYTRRHRVENYYKFFRLIRIGTADLGSDVFSISDFNLYEDTEIESETKLIPFEFNIYEKYLFLVSHGNIAVYRDGDFKTDVKASAILSENIPEFKYTQSADVCIMAQEDTYPQIIRRLNSDYDWEVSNIGFDTIPKHDFNPAFSNPAYSLTPDGVSGIVKITLSAGTVFSASSIGQYIIGKDGNGRARIIEFISVKIVRAYMEIPFFSTDAISAGNWTLHTGFEDVWSISRGFPKTATFHEGRLYFGGSKYRPNTIWASASNDFFNFNLGSGYEADGISATLDTDQINDIVNLRSSGGNLLIFTTTSEFSVSGGENGITPATFNPRNVSNYGSYPFMNMSNIDNTNIFVARGSKSIISYIYDTLQQISNIQNISSLSSHMVFDVKDISARKSNSISESNLVLFINGDYNLIVCAISLAEESIGFTRRITDGKFLNVLAIDSEIYVIVERSNVNSTYKSLESYTKDCYLDSSKVYKSTLPRTVFDGLDHLEGKEVQIIADGAVLSPQIVVAGQVEIENDAADYCEIGLNMTPEIETVPLNFLNIANQAGKRKRISQAILHLKNTSNIVVDGHNVDFRTFSPEGSEVNLPSFSGIKKVSGLRIHGYEPTLEIKQNVPTDFTLLTLTLKG